MKKKLLFVCIENSNRSQMAQAFAAMNELGYDLSTHASTSITEAEPYAPFDAVFTMGCGDACPRMPAKKFYDWQIPDRRAMHEEEFRGVRDLIAQKVKELITALQTAE